MGRAPNARGEQSPGLFTNVPLERWRACLPNPELPTDGLQRRPSIPPLCGLPSGLCERFGIAALLYCCIAVLLYCCIAVLLYCCIAVLLYCCIHSIVTLQLLGITQAPSERQQAPSRGLLSVAARVHGWLSSAVAGWRIAESRHGGSRRLRWGYRCGPGHRTPRRRP